MIIPMQASGRAQHASQYVAPGGGALAAGFAARRAPVTAALWPWRWSCIPNCICVRQEGCPCCGPGEWPILTAPWLPRG